ncbi:MAG TPA: HlyD family type I secretion periplasmic adaptor subunit [Geminicoccaceae bacterium]|nr:HlyD family type I secretion periplasmic adaptor subunit [Geminicoccaceae bacterium]
MSAPRAPTLPAVLAPPDEAAELPRLAGTLVLGAITVAALVLGVGGWTLFARLDSAVITQGVVIAASERKTVQHLEGGILKALLVRDGDRVRAGEVIAVLDTTQAEAQHDQLLDQLVAVRARLARLEAEHQGRRELALPPELEHGAGPRQRAPVEAQRQILAARWLAFDGKLAVLDRRISQLESEIAGAAARLGATRRQLALYREEQANVERLVKQGIERRPRLLELERNVAVLEGELGELEHAIRGAEEAIAQARLEIDNAHSERLAEVAQGLEQARLERVELESRLRAARDVLDRREIRAPQDGAVVDIRLVTPGGVIGAGQPLMDIVPTDDELVIETHLPPDAIDAVHPGLPAQVRLSAYKRSLVPLVDGEVTRVSADMLQDRRTGEGYFLARVRLAAGALAGLQGVHLTPGMPAEVMIVTGERRALDYFLGPLADHLRRAFRED